MVKLFCVLMYWILWYAISFLMAEEVRPEFRLRHPSAIDKCMDDEKTLAIDYSMHPYYLRADLDGDSKMEYVLSVLGSPEWKRQGIMICRENGTKTIYRGIADRKGVDEDKERITNKWGRIVKDAILIESKSSDLQEYSVKKCCYGRGNLAGQLIFLLNANESSRAIPLGVTWHPISKEEMLGMAHDILGGEGEIVGEGVGSAWELTFTYGFMQGGQFRWLICTHPDLGGNF